jgi:hypothetical protein
VLHDPGEGPDGTGPLLGLAPIARTSASCSPTALTIGQPEQGRSERAEDGDGDASVSTRSASSPRSSATSITATTCPASSVRRTDTRRSDGTSDSCPSTA